MKSLLSLFVIIGALFGQEGQQVNLSTGFEPRAATTLLFYSGTDLEYTCKAWATQSTFFWARTDSTLTNIVDSSNTSTVTTSTAHGLAVGNLVTVSGATVDTDLNGTYVIQTVGSSTTFTITTASVSDATYTETGLQVSTTAPRTTAAIWEIKHFTVAATLVTAIQTSEGRSQGRSICANRATTTGATKTSFQ